MVAISTGETIGSYLCSHRRRNGRRRIGGEASSSRHDSNLAAPPFPRDAAHQFKQARRNSLSLRRRAMAATIRTPRLFGHGELQHALCSCCDLHDHRNCHLRRAASARAHVCARNVRTQPCRAGCVPPGNATRRSPRPNAASHPKDRLRSWPSSRKLHRRQAKHQDSRQRQDREPHCPQMRLTGRPAARRAGGHWN